MHLLRYPRVAQNTYLSSCPKNISRNLSIVVVLYHLFVSPIRSLRQYLRYLVHPLKTSSCFGRIEFTFLYTSGTTRTSHQTSCSTRILQAHTNDRARANACTPASFFPCQQLQSPEAREQKISQFFKYLSKRSDDDVYHHEWPTCDKKRVHVKRLPVDEQSYIFTSSLHRKMPSTEVQF
jgi:hypothetical protein